MNLITHGYNPHNIPNFFLNSNMFFSLIPLISVSLSLSSKHNDGLLPTPTPPLICHHPTIMLQKLVVHFSHPPLFIRSGKILISLSLIEFFPFLLQIFGNCSQVWASLISIFVSSCSQISFFFSFFFFPETLQVLFCFITLGHFIVIRKGCRVAPSQCAINSTQILHKNLSIQVF